MLPLLGSSRRLCDGVSRRELLRLGGLGFAALSLPEFLSARSVRAASEAGQGGSFGRARSAIVIYLQGGPAHQDIWDLKPDAPAEVRGEFAPIATATPGYQVCEHVPRLAALAYKYAVIRSVTHDDPEHNSAMYAAMTGHPHPQKGRIVPPRPNDFPPHGAVVSLLHGQRASSAEPAGIMPPWVTVPAYLMNNSVPYPSQNAGFLGAGYEPMFVRGDPNRADFSVAGLTPAVEIDRLRRRRELLGDLTPGAAYLDGSPFGRAVGANYERAFDLVTGRRAQQAFDLASEDPRTRDRYGRNTFGQCALLARRLVETGVSLVTVYGTNGGQAHWDTHGNNFPALRDSLLPPQDLGFSALLEDLEARGLLDETLVVWIGEFGRTPRINNNAGRDHWPWVYSVVMAGASVRGGAVYGSSDREAGRPASDPVSPADLAATLYHLLGIDPGTHIHDPLDRPLALSSGRVIHEIL